MTNGDGKIIGGPEQLTGRNLALYGDEFNS